MPRLTDDAVVLRRFDWSETSQIAWLFTRAHGLVRGVAKGAKRPKSAFDGGLEPLTRGEVGAIVKPDSDLATLTSWDLRVVCWAARSSLEANRAALFAAGLLASIVSDHDPHPPIFDALVGLLDALDAGDDPWGGAARFQWVALVDTGHAPQLEQVDALARDADVMGFDPHAGAFTPDPGAHAHALWRVRSTTGAGVAALAGGEIPPAGEATARVNRFLLSYWTWVLGREPRVARLLSPDLSAAGEPRQG